MQPQPVQCDSEPLWCIFDTLMRGLLRFTGDLSRHGKWDKWTDFALRNCEGNNTGLHGRVECVECNCQRGHAWILHDNSGQPGLVQSSGDARGLLLAQRSRMYLHSSKPSAYCRWERVLSIVLQLVNSDHLHYYGHRDERCSSAFHHCTLHHPGLCGCSRLGSHRGERGNSGSLDGDGLAVEPLDWDGDPIVHNLIYDWDHMYA